MGRRPALVAAIVGCLLGTGCAYEFSEKYFLVGAKFRQEISHPIHDLHDLVDGEATIVILRDSQEGMNIGTGNILKLGFEMREFEVGVPIHLPSQNVAVRFSDLDGIPPKSGMISSIPLKGSYITVLEQTKQLLIVECHLIMQMTDYSNRGQFDAGEAEIEGVFECARIDANLARLDPYYGGTRDTYSDESPRDRK